MASNDGFGVRRECTSFTPLVLLLALLCRDTGSSYVSGGYGTGTGAGFNSLQPPASPAPPPLPPPGRHDPYFDAMTPRNVTALVGKSAYLSCRVRNLGNKTVSWIRHRDIHILTVGGYTYTSDQRFQSNHHRDNEEWILQIKWSQKRDAGIYECQISTQPVRSYFVNLNIVVPTAAILGGPDLHVDKGSTINLTCTIKYSPEPPAYIFWYHHEEVISYDSSRGGVSVITEKGEVTTSYLLIQHAELSDSGKYSCRPSNADVASVRVYVLNEDLKSDSPCFQRDEVSIRDQIHLNLPAADAPRLDSPCTTKEEPSLTDKIHRNYLTGDRNSELPRGFNADINLRDQIYLNFTRDETRLDLPRGFRDEISLQDQIHQTLPTTGERPAAMQTGSAGLSNSSLNIVTLFLLCLFYSFAVQDLQLNDSQLCEPLTGR